MKNGFVKIAVASPEIRVADCDFNAKQIISAMQKAVAAGAKLLALPEMCITGYTCSDLFLQSTLLDGAENALREIALASGDALTVAGLPVRYCGKLYAGAAVLQNGKILGIVPKTHLPNYNEFYEKRHFNSPLPENTVIEIAGQSVPFGTRLLFCNKNIKNFIVAVEICEDLWSVTPPSNSHAVAGAIVIVNISASDEVVSKAKYRRELVCGQSARLICGYVYSDAGEGESTTDLVFAAHNIIAENGSLLNESRFTDEPLLSEIDVDRIAFERMRIGTFPPVTDAGYERIMFETEIEKTKLTRFVDRHPFVPGDIKERKERCEVILNLQALGLKKRIIHSRSKTAVIGISGGLDSTLALLVAVRAMKMQERPLSDIVTVTMPCFGTTKRTKSNAEKLCACLGTTFLTVDITDSVKRHFKDIGHDINNQNVVFENSQARERTQVLMDIANKTNGLVIGTGDLSELALGWATYNGDHMSMYGVNGSIPKTLVRYLVAYEAEACKDDVLKETLLDVLDTPVSPELISAVNGEIAQKTEELIGPYELHDFFLYYAIRWAFPPKKVYDIARYAFNGEYSDEVILKWLKNFYKRFFSQQFKRSCLPDGPKVGTVTLSPRGDWRMPSDASAELWLAQLDEI